MAKCIVCVELEQAPPQTYADLRRMLLNAGLRDTIGGRSKAEYRLPTGAFSYDGPLDQAKLRDSLDVVVGSLGLPYGLLVTTGTSSWTLEQVKAPPAPESGQKDDGTR